MIMKASIKNNLKNSKMKNIEKFARVCDVTNKGMNEGFCWGEGGFYTINEEITIKELRNDIDSGGYDFEDISKEDLLNKSDDDLLSWAYDSDILYYTEWYDEEYCEGDLYYDADGNEYEVKEEI